MSTLIKKLKAFIAGKELSWNELRDLLIAFGAVVQEPRGGGSHFKIIFSGKPTFIVPVHKGKIKRVYARKLAELLEEYEE